MTAKLRVDLSCDWPTLGKLLYQKTCQVTDWRRGNTIAKGRQSAVVHAGWLRVGDYDFCGPGDPDEGRTEPLPNHAALLSGHSLAITKTRVGLYDRWRPSCACGWASADGVIHQAVYGPGREGLARSREKAGQAWLEVHVREHLAGLPPLTTQASLDKAIEKVAAETAAYWEEVRANERRLADQGLITLEEGP